jgi:hypothetical protein
MQTERLGKGVEFCRENLDEQHVKQHASSCVVVNKTRPLFRPFKFWLFSPSNLIKVKITAAHQCKIEKRRWEIGKREKKKPMTKFDCSASNMQPKCGEIFSKKSTK